MSLASKTNLDEAHFYQNADITAAVKQVAGEEEISVSATTQEIDVSIYHTKATTAAAASVATLPAGLFPGQRKVITVAALGTAGDELTVTPGAGVTAKKSDGSTALASLTFDAANEYALIEWDGAQWVVQTTTATEA